MCSTVKQHTLLHVPKSAIYCHVSEIWLYYRLLPWGIWIHAACMDEKSVGRIGWNQRTSYPLRDWLLIHLGDLFIEQDVRGQVVCDELSQTTLKLTLVMTEDELMSVLVWAITANLTLVMTEDELMSVLVWAITANLTLMMTEDELMLVLVWAITANLTLVMSEDELMSVLVWAITAKRPSSLRSYTA